MSCEDAGVVLTANSMGRVKGCLDRSQCGSNTVRKQLCHLISHAEAAERRMQPDARHACCELYTDFSMGLTTHACHICWG